MGATTERRLRRGRARRTFMAAVTSALVALLAVPLLATPAAAAPTATVVISEATTPLAVSVDVGGTVTFINSIPARTDLLGVTLATDVTVALPSGRHKIDPGGSWAEVFNASCLTCTVSYKYRVTVGILPPLVGLPALPLDLPMVVNTIVPVPTLPAPPVNAPSLPVPESPGVPQVPGVPSAPEFPSAPEPPTAPSVPAAPGAAVPPTSGTDPGETVGEQVMPDAGGPLVLGAPNGFEQRNGGSAVAEQRSGGSVGQPSLSGGSGTGIGSYDGAEPPVFGVLDGLDVAPSGGSDGVRPSSALQNETLPRALGTPALLAVLMLSVVSAGLIRTAAASRRAKKIGAQSSS